MAITKNVCPGCWHYDCICEDWDDENLDEEEE